MQATLDRTSGVPLYRQIKEILRFEVVSGVANAEQPMTEEELIRRFHVSRAPIRQALKELTDEGYVYRERAKGTFPVAGLHVERPDSVRLGGLYEYLVEQGLHPVSRVSDIGWMDAPADVADRLALEPDEQLLHFTRLISVEGEPLVRGDIFLRAPKEFAPTVQELEESSSAFALLDRDYGIVLGRAEHEAWAAAATADDAALLDVAEGSPVLIVETRFFTKEGRPGGMRKAVHRAEQFKYRFTTNR